MNLYCHFQYPFSPSCVNGAIRWCYKLLQKPRSLMEQVNTETGHLFCLETCICGSFAWTLESKERRHRPWRISSDKTHSARGKSSSEEFCVSVIPISQISEHEAGGKKEVAEAAVGTPRSGSALKSHQFNYYFVNQSSGKYTLKTRRFLLLSSLMD